MPGEKKRKREKKGGGGGMDCMPLCGVCMYMAVSPGVGSLALCVSVWLHVHDGLHVQLHAPLCVAVCLYVCSCTCVAVTGCVWGEWLCIITLL